MDKNTLIGLFLIGAILLTFTVMNNDEEEQKESSVKDKKEQVINQTSVSDSATLATQIEIESPVLSDSLIIAGIADSLQTDSLYVANYVDSVKLAQENLVVQTASKQLENEYGIFATAAMSSELKTTVLENDKIAVTISNKGGQIIDVKLKEYQSYDDYIATPDSMSGLHLFDGNKSSFGLALVNNGIPLSTSGLFFTPQHSESVVLVEDTNTASIVYRLNTNDPTKYVDFSYSLKKGVYDVGFDIEYVNLKNIDDIDYSNTQINWKMTALATEKLASDERTIATTMFRYFDQKRDYISERGDDEIVLESKTNWVAIQA